MSDVGKIGWFDLTVPNADEVKDFYAKVVGWNPDPVSMGDYNDYNMTKDGTPITGVCHKRGTNEKLPSQWLIYIYVEDLEKSLNECLQNGGEKVDEIKDMGEMGKFCVIKDPAGAVCALFEKKN